MTPAAIQAIIEKNKHDLAFVIGNGINRYPDNPDALSWDDLLIRLWDLASLHTLSKRPDGISLTEFFDLLELENSDYLELQRQVRNLMLNWKPADHHQRITDCIRQLNAPILTTNFEEIFAHTFRHQLFKTNHTGFTDFYPWTTYHGERQLSFPDEGFGVWYINGMIRYHRSIRLGLGHYMGCVERARTLIHKGKEESLFAENNTRWSGHQTWLHLVFHKSLFIFGLGLEENEVFLRWLLLERIKYFKKFPNRKHKGWYLTKRTNSDSDAGKKFFLERVGFEVIEVDDYSIIYEAIWQ